MIVMNVDEMRNATAAMGSESIIDTIKDTITEEIWGVYSSTEELIQSPIFHLVEEAPIHIVQNNCLDTLTPWIFDKLAESDHPMDALHRSIVEINVLIMCVKQFVKRCLDKFICMGRLESILDRQERANQVAYTKNKE